MVLSPTRGQEGGRESSPKHSELSASPMGCIRGGSRIWHGGAGAATLAAGVAAPCCQPPSLPPPVCADCNIGASGDFFKVPKTDKIFPPSIPSPVCSNEHPLPSPAVSQAGEGSKPLLPIPAGETGTAVVMDMGVGVFLHPACPPTPPPQSRYRKREPPCHCLCWCHCFQLSPSLCSLAAASRSCFETFLAPGQQEKQKQEVGVGEKGRGPSFEIHMLYRDF